MAIGARSRFEIFKRDKFTCQYCGRTPPIVVLHADHIVPKSDGGPDDPLNLITACQDCNLGKSNIPLGQVTKPIQEELEEAVERKQQLQAFNEFLMDARAEEDAAIINIGTYWFDLFCKPGEEGKFTFRPVRAKSIRTFLKFLTAIAICDHMELAHSKVPPDGFDDERTFKYFCGICWKEIKAAQAGGKV